MKGYLWPLLTLLSLLLLAQSAGQAHAQAGSSDLPQAPGAPQAAVSRFSYQGQLMRNGVPVNGSCDLEFRLHDDGTNDLQLGLPQALSNVPIKNGLFTVQLAFGADLIKGFERWIAIWVRCPSGSGGWTPLAPRQPLTAAPLALSLPGLWTEDNLNSPNIIGGAEVNQVATHAVGAVIGGGGNWEGCGGGPDECPNVVTGSFGTVAGGDDNSAGQNSAVGGGHSNVADGRAATVPGGSRCTASGENSFAAGYRAKALHYGSFVWSDRSSSDFASTAPAQFLVRALNGVGINTNNTYAYALTVNGRVIAGGTGVPANSSEPFVARGNFSGITMDDRSDANLRWVIYPNTGSLRFWNGTDRLSIDPAGILTLGALGGAGSTTLCRNAEGQIAGCSSSLRYKQEVAPLSLGLDAIMGLRPVTFAWVSTGEADLGLVAEEVDKVTPLLTTRNADGAIEGVKYDRLNTVLVKGIQEQQAQIAALAAENEALTERLAALEAAMAQPPAGQANGVDWSLGFVAFGSMLAIAVVWQARGRGGI
jgi:hypothetical protein